MALLVLMLAGCGPMKEEAIRTKKEEPKQSVTFVQVGETLYGKIMVCEQTEVMYVVSNGKYNHGTYTLLVNADGTPMLWEESLWD